MDRDFFMEQERMLCKARYNQIEEVEKRSENKILTIEGLNIIPTPVQNLKDDNLQFGQI